MILHTNRRALKIYCIVKIHGIYQLLFKGLQYFEMVVVLSCIYKANKKIAIINRRKNLHYSILFLYTFIEYVLLDTLCKKRKIISTVEDVFRFFQFIFRKKNVKLVNK